MFAIGANHAFDGERFRAGSATVLVEDGCIVGVVSAAYELPSECELVDHGDAIRRLQAPLGAVRFEVGGDESLVDAAGGLDLDVLLDGEQRGTLRLGAASVP